MVAIIVRRLSGMATFKNGTIDEDVLTIRISVYIEHADEQEGIRSISRSGEAGK